MRWARSTWPLRLFHTNMPIFDTAEARILSQEEETWTLKYPTRSDPEARTLAQVIKGGALLDGWTMSLLEDAGSEAAPASIDRLTRGAESMPIRFQYRQALGHILVEIQKTTPP